MITEFLIRDGDKKNIKTEFIISVWNRNTIKKGITIQKKTGELYDFVKFIQHKNFH